MSGFSAQWLALREPLDCAARATSLSGALRTASAGSRGEQTRIAVVDLGAGSGANLRYAAPLIGGAQEWLLVENDPLLLEVLKGQARQFTGAQFECRVQTLALDLATQLDHLPLGAGTWLTASALLDLVSEPWLRQLARRAADAAAVIWFALTYDGRIDCSPAEAEDAEVREWVNLHQLTDKGFGVALGPAAAQRAELLFTEQGYQILCAASDWRIGPEHSALQHALLEGWCQAAVQVAPHRAPVLHGWLLRRRAHIEAGRSQLRVGHVDMLGWPPKDATARKVHNPSRLK